MALNIAVRYYNMLVQWKPTRCTVSHLYFDKELYMFQTDLLSIIRGLNTVFTAVGNCHTSYVDCLLARLGWIPTLDDRQSVRNL
jgi:uncharacterized membrane protein YqaE (UPF0057 family)